MLESTRRRVGKAARLLNPVTFLRTIGRIDDLVQATRDLTTSVDLLRVQTEQLLAIERLNWELDDELQDLPELLDRERIAEHVRRAIAAAPIQDDPFPHIVVEKWLPRNVYEVIIRGIPPSVFFADRDVSRQRLMVPFPVAPAYSQRVWRFMASEIVSGMLDPALTEKFGGVIRDYVRSFCPGMPDDTDLTLHGSDGRIMLRRPGYVITPHRDPKWGFLTGLVYLVRPGDNEAFGTQLYRVRDDREASDGLPMYIDESRCELVKSVPFRANTMLVFMNSVGAHGASIPADAQPPTLERYLYQYRLGPDKQTISRLLGTMTSDRRALWAGSKAQKAEAAALPERVR